MTLHWASIQELPVAIINLAFHLWNVLWHHWLARQAFQENSPSKPERKKELGLMN